MGYRGNSQFLRVYCKDDFLRFEVEFKKRETKLISDLLWNRQFPELEEKLIKRYYKLLSRSLDLTDPYSDWLIHPLRIQSS